MGIIRDALEIDEALTRAKEAKSQQERLFSHIEGYDPNAATALHAFGPNDILSFLEGILPYRQVKIRNRLYNGRVLELELPEEMQGRYSEFPERATVVRVTVDRGLATRNAHYVPMDFASPFFSDLIEYAKSPEFKGEYASLLGPVSGSCGIYKIRWQNDQGMPRWEMLLPVFLPKGNEKTIADPGFFGDLLTTQATGSNPSYSGSLDERQNWLKCMDSCAEAELANRCTNTRHPNDIVLVASADLVADASAHKKINGDNQIVPTL